MSKTVINNEIIILRKFVEQARVHTIKKLTRDVKKYRNKKGTDAQKEKNERKSNKLVAEILSIKKVKKDEITKHILTNNLNLKKVLENETSTPLNRAMVRIAHHKLFSKKIADFKSKYPNYLEFMGPSRKKKAIIEWKEKKKMRNKEKIEKIVVTKEDDEGLEMLHSSDHEDEIKSIGEVSVSSINNEKDNEEENKSKDLNKRKNESIDEKVNETSIVGMEKLEKLMETDLQRNSSAILYKRKKDGSRSEKGHFKQNEIPKIISKQAIVKKLTDILQEDNCIKNYEKEENSETTNSNIEKEVDSFFMTGDERSYLSVAISKDKMTSFKDNFHDNEEQPFKMNKFSRQESNKFFNKGEKLKKNDSKFMTQWEDKKLCKKQRNINICDVEKERKFVRTDRKVALDYKSIEQLHPSWEAKKREQEMLKKGFQGKKIVFGDDV